MLMEIKFAVVQEILRARLSRVEFCSRVKIIFCCAYNYRGDPFEVDPLPKSFYHPSMQRELSDAERKVRPRRQRTLQKINLLKSSWAGTLTCRFPVHMSDVVRS